MVNRVIISEVRNAKSLNEENTFFDLEINHPLHGWLPYTLSPHDTDMTVDNSALLELIGDDFQAYVAPTQEELDEAAATDIRSRRDMALMVEVDPIVSNSLRWADMTTEQQNAWAEFRTDLLNITEQEGFPHNVEWPDKP